MYLNVHQEGLYCPRVAHYSADKHLGTRTIYTLLRRSACVNRVCGGLALTFWLKITDSQNYNKDPQALVLRKQRGFGNRVQV